MGRGELELEVVETGVGGRFRFCFCFVIEEGESLAEEEFGERTEIVGLGRV